MVEESLTLFGTLAKRKENGALKLTVERLENLVIWQVTQGGYGLLGSILVSGKFEIVLLLQIVGFDWMILKLTGTSHSPHNDITLTSHSPHTNLTLIQLSQLSRIQNVHNISRSKVDIVCQLRGHAPISASISHQTSIMCDWQSDLKLQSQLASN